MRGTLRALGLYTLLTVLLTWPMAVRLRLMDAGDSAFFAWVMSWELHALTTDPAQLPHGNIFHPLRYTLGFDEPVLGTTLLVAPLYLFTDDAVFLFNVARLLTFVLSGLTAYWLLRDLGCPERASLVAGIGFGFSLIKSDPVAHLSTLGTQWLPVVLLFTHRFARTGRLQDALLAGLFFVLECLACGYHGLIGLFVLPVAALPLVWGRWRRLAPAGIAIAATAVALFPLYALHQAALVPEEYVRGEGETVHYSASLETFLSASAWNRLYGGITAEFRTAANDLFPGLVRPLAIALWAYGLWRRRERPDRDTLAYAVMGVAAVAVALGPEVRLLGRTLCPGPFAVLREVLPIFQMIRAPSRAGVFLALAITVLAGKALARLEGRPWRLAGVGLLLALESTSAPIPMPDWTRVVDSAQPPPPVYPWLAAQPGDFPIVELPMLDIRGVHQKPSYHESIYLVRSTRHWKRLLNGYAGIEPAGYVRLRELVRRFPSPECLDELRRLGARYVILHRGGYGPLKWARIEAELPAVQDRLRVVATFPGDTVFELVR